MNRLFFLSLFVFSIHCALAQTKDSLRTERWLKKEGIDLNQPQPPEDFQMEIGCCRKIQYTNFSKDTIEIWFEAFSYKVDFEDLKDIKSSVDFNRFFFPKIVESDGAVLFSELDYVKFYWNNDTLFMSVRPTNYHILQDVDRRRLEAFGVWFDSREQQIHRKKMQKSLNLDEEVFIPIYEKRFFKASREVTFQKSNSFPSYKLELISPINISCLNENIVVEIIVSDSFSRLLEINSHQVRVISCLPDKEHLRH